MYLVSTKSYAGLGLAKGGNVYQIKRSDWSQYEGDQPINWPLKKHVRTYVVLLNRISMSRPKCLHTIFEKKHIISVVQNLMEIRCDMIDWTTSLKCDFTGQL